MTSLIVKCEICNKEINKSSLRRHMKSQHDYDGSKVACTYDGCKRKFKDKQSMKSHFSEQHVVSSHSCNMCDVKTDTVQKLNHHKNVFHYKKYMCKYPDCGRNFGSKKNLDVHINMSIEKLGHGGVYYTPPVTLTPAKEDINENKKRKADEINPIDEFLNGIMDQLKDSDPNKKCSNRICVVTRLSYGFMGGDKEYCSKHKNDIPDMVHLSNLNLCRHKGCKTHAKKRIGGYLLCETHIQLLKDNGLPSPEKNIKKPLKSGKICTKEGCEIGASYDDGKFCKNHSQTNISDDKRICEIEGCGHKRPSFGYENMPKTRCKKHKDDNMHSHKLCSNKECFVSASYAPYGDTPLTCWKHKEEGYILVNAPKCSLECCLDGNGPQAKFFHPDHKDETSSFYGKRICPFGMRVLLESSIHNNDVKKFDSMMEHFKLNKICTLNAQSAFRFECEKIYHTELDSCEEAVFDGHVHGGPKTLWSKRPDVFYKFNIDGINYGIQVEYDERKDHEDDTVRLDCIAKDVDCAERIYLIRVYGGHDTDKPLCHRIKKTTFEYHKVTKKGSNVASKVADAVIERIKWIEEGLGPDESRPETVYF